MIAIDPRDSDVVYVAAQGPLWRSGGDRGLYKTTDGGATWQRVLHVSDDTGINEVHLDPRDPDTLYASAYQRRRHVWTLINGGPESAIYKSTDAGATWRKLERGLPDVDLGRIGLDIAPANPDIIYAIVEAAQGNKRGLPFDRSRRDLGKTQRLRLHQPAVLQRDRLRSEGPGPDLLPRYVLTRVSERRRQNGAPLPAGRSPRGRPRPVDRSRRSRLPAGRLRRRGVREFRSRNQLALPEQPAHHPVLPRERGQRPPVLQHLRRHPGQQHARRAVADHRSGGHRQRTLVRNRGRGRLRDAGRPHRSQHRLQPVAVRRADPARPAQR
jgi:hypothetical protein